MRQVIKHREIKLLEMIRRTDPVIPLNGNARLDTVQKIATALGVSMKSLYEPLNDVEGFIRICGKVYQFNNREELNRLLNS